MCFVRGKWFCKSMSSFVRANMSIFGWALVKKTFLHKILLDGNGFPFLHHEWLATVINKFTAGPSLRIVKSPKIMICILLCIVLSILGICSCGVVWFFQKLMDWLCSWQILAWWLTNRLQISDHWLTWIFVLVTPIILTNLCILLDYWLIWVLLW
jgi:hypothetical protein